MMTKFDGDWYCIDCICKMLIEAKANAADGEGDGYPRFPGPVRETLRQDVLDRMGEKVIRLRKKLHKAQHQIRVGVAVLVINDKNEILFGKRKGSHGAGTFSLPGGHVDFGERPRDTVPREVKEETGMDVWLVARHKECPWGYAVFEKEDKQYITLFFTARSGSQTPKLLEPDKCEGWEWYPLQEWPEPLFGALTDGPAAELLKQGVEDLLSDERE